MSKITIHIDAEQCINCFDCSDRIPEIFTENTETGVHTIIRPPANEAELMACEDSAYHCPIGIITIEYI